MVRDVGAFLQEHAARFPSLAQHLDRIVTISRRLREDRELSFYGDESAGAPPERLYDVEDAEAALRDARFVIDLCAGLVPSS